MKKGTRKSNNYNHPDGDIKFVGSNGEEIKLVLPPDANKNEETRLYLGDIAVNGRKRNRDKRWWQFWKPKYIYVPETENWTKTNVTPLEFVLDPAWQDKLLENQDVGISYKRDT